MEIKIKISELEIWYDPKHCLKAVERSGYALRYVKEQTPEVCLKAVENDGDALQYVKEQTPEVCLKAVERNGDALRYVARTFWDLFKGVISEL